MGEDLKSGFFQFRVSELGDHEIDDNSDNAKTSVIRLFLTSRIGEQIALEIPFSLMSELMDFFGAASKQFPNWGKRVQ